MRWTVLSVLVALILSLFGLWVSDPLAGNVAPKAIFWFIVVAFLSIETSHFCAWVHDKDL